MHLILFLLIDCNTFYNHTLQNAHQISGSVCNLIYKKKKKNYQKNMLLKNKNYNKVNATLDNRNQKNPFFLNST